MLTPPLLPTLQTGNVAETLFLAAKAHPERLAISMPIRAENGSLSFEDISYGDLLGRVKRWMSGLMSLGLKPGDRVLVLFPVGIELYSVIPALYAIGCVALLVDPGMGAKKITQALNIAKPKAVISVKALLKWRYLLGALRRIPIKIGMDCSGWGVVSRETVLETAPANDEEPLPRKPSDQALVTFTSGSTGAPKGADRNHGFLLAQHAALKAAYPAEDGQIDMTCFPVVVFHNLMCGVTSVMPDADIARPASVEPNKVIDQLAQSQIQTLSGGPAFIEKIVDALLVQGTELPALRTLACGGGPVSGRLQNKIVSALPNATCYVVYGSTEAEPMCHHVMGTPCESSGGFIAGKPLSFVDLKLVNLPKRPDLGLDLESFSSEGVGEVIVSGAHVNESYIDNEQANRENKVRDSMGIVWHRTGDRGRFDTEGNLWLVGRVKDVVLFNNEPHDPFLIESVVGRLEFISQAALIEGKKGVALFVSPRPLLEQMTALEKVIEDSGLLGVRLLSSSRLPVDGRHNSKIDRPTLRVWLDRFWWFGKPYEDLSC